MCVSSLFLFLHLTHSPDLYSPILGQAPAVDELFSRLKSRVAEEVQVQKGLASLLGSVDSILAGAALKGGRGWEGTVFPGKLAQVPYPPFAIISLNSIYP